MIECDFICTKFVTDKSLPLEEFLKLSYLGPFKMLLFYYESRKANHVLYILDKAVEDLVEINDKYILLSP